MFENLYERGKKVPLEQSHRYRSLSKCHWGNCALVPWVLGQIQEGSIRLVSERTRVELQKEAQLLNREEQILIEQKCIWG